EHERPTVEFVGAADERTRVLDVFTSLLGRQRVADRLPAQMIQMRFEHVLRGRDQRETHHGVFGHLSNNALNASAPLRVSPVRCPVAGGVRKRSSTMTR